MSTSLELRGQLSSLVAQSRQITNAAKSETRDLTAEEYDTITSNSEAFDRLEKEIRTAEADERIEHYEGMLKASQGRKVPPAAPSQRVTETRTADPAERNEFTRLWALGGTEFRAAPDQVYKAAGFGFDLNARQISLRAMPTFGTEDRALSKGTTTAGGYDVPTDFAPDIDKAVAYYLPVREAFGNFSTADGHDYPQPTVTDVANSAGIVTEASGIGTSTDPTFGQVTFKSFDYYSPIVKVSKQLLRDARADVPALLSDLFAERMGRALDTAIVSSNAGSSAPEGALHGVSAGVNLATSNPMTLAKLLTLETSVDPAYRNLPGTCMVMHDATWQAIRGMVTSTGAAVFGSINVDLQNAISKQLLGYKVYISNSMTSITAATDNEPLILFGNLQKYKIRSIASADLTRLDELYAGNGQVGFVLHQAWDARWVQPTAAKTLNAFDAP